MIRPLSLRFRVPGFRRRRLLVALLALSLAGCGSLIRGDADRRPQAREISFWTLDLAPRFSPSSRT